MAQTVLVTGATGFVGSALCASLRNAGYRVRGAVRSLETTTHGDPGLEYRTVGDIAAADWRVLCTGVDFVVHLAARTHRVSESGARCIDEYRRVNVEGTKQVALAAATCGVRRFVYISSVKVNGESTQGSRFTPDDPPRPEDAYGISKWEAEQVLRGISTKRALEMAILRPPLVYGPGVKGNFERLLRLTATGLPLPFASIRNQRSLIYVANLVDAIAACLRSPAMAGGTYLVSDDEDVSTPDLIRSLAQAMGVQARLFSMPAGLMMFLAGLVRSRGAVARLTGSLQVDISKFKADAGWHPRHSLAKGLSETAVWYRNSSLAPRRG